jgi:hypothetical protein
MSLKEARAFAYVERETYLRELRLNSSDLLPEWETYTQSPSTTTTDLEDNWMMLQRPARDYEYGITYFDFKHWLDMYAVGHRPILHYNTWWRQPFLCSRLNSCWSPPQLLHPPQGPEWFEQRALGNSYFPNLTRICSSFILLFYSG